MIHLQDLCLIWRRRAGAAVLSLQKVGQVYLIRMTNSVYKNKPYKGIKEPDKSVWNSVYVDVPREIAMGCSPCRVVKKWTSSRKKIEPRQLDIEVHR